MPFAARVEGLVGLVRGVVAGQRLDAQVRREAPGGRLVAHRPDRAGRRPDPADPAVLDRRGEVGLLGQEAVAGVEGVGARGTGGRHDRGAVEQVDERRSVRARDHRPDAQPFARSAGCVPRSRRDSPRTGPGSGAPAAPARARGAPPNR